MASSAVLLQGSIDIYWCKNCGSLEYHTSPGLKNGRIEVSEDALHENKTGRWVSYHTQPAGVIKAIRRFVSLGCDVRVDVACKKSAHKATIYLDGFTSSPNLAKLKHETTCFQATSLPMDDKMKNIFSERITITRLNEDVYVIDEN
ncbi:MAG TPA: hypothetical protein VLG76_01710 [Rhabdochlamydiaceae bacterium]|nr:hypothetical protein [Rhabdochlamydiaceae bacterium]